MDTEPKKFKIHPLTATAAVAVILVSMTGIAAMTGLLPNFSKTPEPETAATTPTTNESQIAADQIANTAPASAAAVSEPAPVATVKKSPAKKPTYVASNTTTPATPEIAPVPQDPQAPLPPPPPAPCPNCGVVESARAIQQQAQTSGVGAAAGALLGGVLGHQVGGGAGKTLATIAGAVGGGFAGNAVEKNTHTTTSYEVIVRMEDGSRQRFIMSAQRWRSGDLVRVDNGNLSSRG
jgi:outer membrane lipoprotein SlyB